MSHSPSPGRESIAGATATTDAQDNSAPRAAASDFTATDGYHEAAGARRVDAMSRLVDILGKIGLLATDLDYHLLRATMVIIFLFFGYQKWFEYEAQALIPYISNGPLIFWLYPAFGIRGACWFLGVAEWSFGALLFLGFWNKKLGILGAAGSTATFIGTVTIIPFMPNGWAESAGGFPAMTEHVAFLMKDLVLLAVSVYLLRQDVMRASLATGNRRLGQATVATGDGVAQRHASHT